MCQSLDGQELSRRQVDCCVMRFRRARSSGIRSADFGGADDGRGTIVGRPWSRRWPREVRRAAGGPTMAAGGSAGFGGARQWRRDDARASEEPTMTAERLAGFGGADNGRGRFGGAVDG